MDTERNLIEDTRIHWLL